jgi:hypothetical protein
MASSLLRLTGARILAGLGGARRSSIATSVPRRSRVETTPATP